MHEINTLSPDLNVVTPAPTRVYHAHTFVA